MHYMVFYFFFLYIKVNLRIFKAFVFELLHPPSQNISMNTISKIKSVGLFFQNIHRDYTDCILLHNAAFLLTLSGWTESTALRYTFFTWSAVTKSCIPTCCHLFSPSHKTLSNEHKRALILRSLPWIHSKTWKNCSFV